MEADIALHKYSKREVSTCRIDGLGVLRSQSTGHSSVLVYVDKFKIFRKSVN